MPMCQASASQIRQNRLLKKRENDASLGAQQEAIGERQARAKPYDIGISRLSVSRLNRGTSPANAAGASRNGLSGLIIDKRAAGFGTCPEKMTVPAGISIPSSLFPFVQITDAPAAGFGNGYLRAVKDSPRLGKSSPAERRERKSMDGNQPRQTIPAFVPIVPTVF